MTAANAAREVDDAAVGELRAGAQRAGLSDHGRERWLLVVCERASAEGEVDRLDQR
jgi:hypothetical protein